MGKTSPQLSPGRGKSEREQARLILGAASLSVGQDDRPKANSCGHKPGFSKGYFTRSILIYSKYILARMENIPLLLLFFRLLASSVAVQEGVKTVQKVFKTRVDNMKDAKLILVVIIESNPLVVYELIKDGADVNAKNNIGSVLDYARGSKCTRNIDVLMKAGAY